MEHFEKLMNDIKPKKVVSISVYWHELDKIFHATISINTKPTGENTPEIGHGVSRCTPLAAIESAASTFFYASEIDAPDKE